MPPAGSAQRRPSAMPQLFDEPLGHLRRVILALVEIAPYNCHTGYSLATQTEQFTAGKEHGAARPGQAG
jgi:hypothetical protein